MGLEIGILSLVYNATKDLIKALYPRGKKDHASIIEHRSKIKRLLDAQMGVGGELEEERDIIVRDASRVDSYPNNEEKGKKISPWFKVGFLGIYHKGILVGLSYEGIKWDDVHQGWRYNNHPEEKEDLTAAVVGKIPFDDIIEIDWDGDEYYRQPHFYCRFSQSKQQPYEAIVFAEGKEGLRKKFYSDICNAKDVYKLSKKLKVGHYRKQRQNRT